MKVIGLQQAEQDNIFRMLAAILWLGNVSFREDDQGNAAIVDQSVVDFVAYLLEVESAHVNKALTIRIVETSRGGRRGSVYDVPLNCAQAMAVRDALSKAIYFNLFDWIVERVNLSLKARGATAHSIGILDIYGFEIFERKQLRAALHQLRQRKASTNLHPTDIEGGTRRIREGADQVDAYQVLSTTRSCANSSKRSGHRASSLR